MSKPIRFGVSVGATADGASWRVLAREVESMGFDLLLVADHLVDDSFPPLLALASAAEVTETIHLGTYVLNNDFHQPVVLAREAAMLGLLSDGRFELGIGAGHMASEYVEAGFAFDPASVRVDRLEESVTIIRSLLDGDTVTHQGRHHIVAGHAAWPIPPAGQPLPIIVGGNGRRVHAIGARLADGVAFTGFAHNVDATSVDLSDFRAEVLDQQVGLVRGVAGARFDDLDLSILVQQVIVTQDRPAAVERLHGWLPEHTDDEILDSPYLLIGSPAEIAETMRERADRYGIRTWVTFAGGKGTRQPLDLLAPIVDQLH